MYDKVRMETTIDRDEAKEIVSRVGNFEYHEKPTGMSYYTNKDYKGLFLYVSADANVIKIDGSLAKYYFGNNVDMLTRELTEKAIIQLSNDLGIDLLYAKVTSLEFGANFKMSHPVQEYLDRIGECPRMRRNNKDTTIYFESKAKEDNVQRIIKLYNKQKELIEKGNAPFGYDIKNLLRIEIAYTKHVNQQLKAEVFASTLYDEAFYNSMVQRFLKVYKSISKYKTIDTKNISRIKKVSDAVPIAILLMATMGGCTEFNIEWVINLFKSFNVYPPEKRHYYNRLKNKLKEAMTDVRITKTDARVIELDEMVEDLCQNQIAI